MRWNLSSGNYTLGDIDKLFKAKKLIINKEYQRGFVWSDRFQRDLIISLLKGNPINSIVLRPSIVDDDVLEIVDGQQRIMTIINFINPENEKDRVLLNSTHGNIAKEILSESKTINSFKDIDEFTQINFKSQISLPFQTIDGTDEEIKNYFNMIQQQEEVKAGEIISNMPFEIYDDLKEYFDDSDEFLKYMGFNNKRGNFLKLLLSNFGIKNKIFSLGATDDEVIKFAKDMNKAFKENKKFKEITKDHFKNDIKHSFIFLKRIDKSLEIGKGKLRFLRLFLLITNLIKENSFINIEFLALINTQLSIVNNKDILVDDEKRSAFIEKLISLEILSDDTEFSEFIKLSDLFSKTKRITDKHLDTINIWKNKVITE
ncbi:MAG: DUF262 domain-containing protein [Mycoplasmataceae bacterium]|nr:DUF262 domain-containing protein [Mycoplasmataceae bacterium]